MRETGPGPIDVKSMIAWLKRNPDEPFFFTEACGQMLCGFRNDEGELQAYAAKITDSAWAFDRRNRGGHGR